MTKIHATSLAALLLASACTSAELDGDVDQDVSAGKADQISGNDDPSGLLADAERRLGELVSENDVGQSYGVPSDRVPYPDTYWPMIDNGVAVQWLEKDGSRCASANECADPQPSPLAKLVNATSPFSVQDAIDWEVQNHGKEREGVADWWGHCPGWVASTMLTKPVAGPLSARMVDGAWETCDPSEFACTTFQIGDLNAVSAEAHEGAISQFIGARCDTAPTEIERDEHGRIVRKGAGCQGLNAGSMLILMGNRLKKDHLPFAIDAQNESNTDQIWNQPAYRYQVNRFEKLTEAEAANLVATGGASRVGSETSYLWNDAAAGYALVDMSLFWVQEYGPNITPAHGEWTTREMRMLAVIELDAEASDPNAKVVGGEYLDDASVGADRLTVAPFAWIASDVGFSWSHNPFVDGEQVKALVELAPHLGE
jgi:hypothetical protein